MTRLLVFGSRNLTARHLPAMRRFIAEAGLYTWRWGEKSGEEVPCDPPCDWTNGKSVWPPLPKVPDDARFRENLVLIHGDGPPGKTPGAVGADKLAEIAASLEWPDTRRCRRFPPGPGEGESWGVAAARRNAAMVALRPDRALCFHTDLDRSKGSAMTAEFLTRAGLKYRYVKLSNAGEVLSVEER